MHIRLDDDIDDDVDEDDEDEDEDGESDEDDDEEEVETWQVKASGYAAKGWLSLDFGERTA